MRLSEEQARKITFLRVLEQTDNGGLWTESQATLATSAARDLLPPQSSLLAFVARRAEWATAALAKKGVEAPAPLPWFRLAGWLVISMAPILGFLACHLFADQRVNIVEWPILVLVAWSLLVFILCFPHLLVRLFSPNCEPGWRALFDHWPITGVAPGPWRRPFTLSWNRQAAPFRRARLDVILHSAAIFFVLGALANLFFRGFFREYSAGWESTFLGAGQIHFLASALLAPAQWFLGLSVPDVSSLQNLRAPGHAGENAARWITMYAVSILLWVVVPRLILLCMSLWSFGWLKRHFPLPTNSLYFSALNAERLHQPSCVAVVPFRYELSDEIKENFLRILQRLEGLPVSVAQRPPVLMGEDDKDWKSAIDGERPLAVFVIFNLAATAETEVHGLFIKRLLKALGGHHPVYVLVDTSSYPEQNQERLKQRQRQWQRVLDAWRCVPLFINLKRANADDVQALEGILRV